MYKFLRPERFDTEPDEPNSSQQWLHWHPTFSNFMDELANHPATAAHKLKLLINYIAPSIYETH